MPQTDTALSNAKNAFFLDFPEENYSAQKTRNNISILAWIVGTIFVIGLTFLGSMLVVPLFYLMPVEWQLEVNPDFPRSGYAEAIFLWLTFVPAFIAPFVIYKYWHKLPFKRLVTFADKFRWKRVFIALFLVVIVYGLVTLVEYGLDPSEFDEVRLHTDWQGFAILLAVTLIFLPIQSASEEILCRGYLNQGLSLITKQPWIAFGLTSAFFALLHLANPEADGQVWPYMIDTFIFGMAMCWLSYTDQGLESAIGAHIGNNLFVFVLFGYADPILPQSAIFMAPEPVIEWKDTLQGAFYTLGIAFFIIKLNQRFFSRQV